MVFGKGAHPSLEYLGLKKANRFNADDQKPEAKDERGDAKQEAQLAAASGTKIVFTKTCLDKGCLIEGGPTAPATASPAEPLLRVPPAFVMMPPNKNVAQHWFVFL